MPSPPAAAPDPAAPLIAARLLQSLGGLDLTSADGRAGIRALLSEIERLAPGAILRQAATIELDRVGWRRGASRPDDGRGRGSRAPQTAATGTPTPGPHGAA
ncbi:MAG: hypothetical protein KJ916_04040 [Alphaproteobacteria bacterium]|nr:hypothetical protein [Alphaproteobacteria bacterium]